MEPPGFDRRRFTWLALAGLATGCAAGTGGLIELDPWPAPRGKGRAFPGYFDSGTSSFRDHIQREALSFGGIDYAPTAGEDTLITPVAAGTVITVFDVSAYGGMTITVAHGLGWKTLYAHLQARFVDVRERVDRRQVMAIMGATGLGATRGGLGVARHLHLSLFGPAWAPHLAGVMVQRHRTERPTSQFVLDPEEFSLSGRSEYLPYSRAEDSAHDDAFLKLHAEAVTVADELLDRLGDADAARVKARSRFERITQFDFDVDQRLWFLWTRLEGAAHPFGADQARERRAALRRFMSATPRFTAPIVEADRRAEYRRRRPAPLKVYDGRAL